MKSARTPFPSVILLLHQLLRRPVVGVGALLGLALSPQLVRAQARVTISGTIKDAKTGEDLTGASIHIAELPGTGTAANAYGFYTLTLPAGTYTVEASFVGYAAQPRKVTLDKSQRLDFKLSPGGQELNEGGGDRPQRQPGQHQQGAIGGGDAGYEADCQSAGAVWRERRN